MTFITVGWKTKRGPNSHSSTSSKSSNYSIATRKVQAIVKKLSRQRFRDSTRETYYRVWKLFNLFFIRLDNKPRNWEERLILFTGFLVNKQLQLSTVKSYISTIRAVFKEMKIKVNEDTFLINTYFTKNENNQLYIRKLYKAIYAAGYFGLLRIGEVSKSPHVIKAKDAFMGENKDKFLFILHSSKMHCRGDKPQKVKIACSPVNNRLNSNQVGSTPSPDKYCPFQILSDYIDKRPLAIQSREQFFVFQDNTPVTPSHIYKNLNSMFKEMGLDQHNYSFHSLSSGRTQDLRSLGLSIETIKNLGRWKTNAVFT